MKLTIVTEHYPPEPGGVATSSRRVAEALDAAGHPVQVLAFDRTLPPDSVDQVTTRRENGIDIHRVGPFHVSHPTPHKLRAMFRRRACEQMTRLATAFEPNAFLAFYLLNAGFLTRFIAAELRRPYFVSVRGNDIGLDAFDTERFAAVRWTLEGAAGIVCVNERLQRRVLTIAPNLLPPVVIANGVASQFRTEKEPYGDDLTIVFIGTLREKKGVGVLLEAVRIVADLVPIKLVVVGPEVGPVEQQMVRSTWNDLRDKGTLYCTGQVPREDVAQWARQGDIVVMPSVDDGLANGLLEGMALGLCPVASAIFRDVIRDNDNGLLFDPMNAADLVAVLLRLAKDRALVRRLGEAARDHVRQHHRPDVEAAAYVCLMTPSTFAAAVAAPSIDIDG
jgi:glycosyltransferase involved in cell wall biosynthesis